MSVLQLEKRALSSSGHGFGATLWETVRLYFTVKRKLVPGVNNVKK